MRRKTISQQSAQPAKQAPAPVSKAQHAAPNSAVLNMMQQNMSAEDAVMSGINSLPSTQVEPSAELSDKILGRLGIPADSLKIYRDSGLSEFGQSAYAKGGEIHVSDELYSPGTSFGEHLLLHEAAHVLQSGLGGISGGGLLDDSGLEAQAEALAAGGAADAGLDVSGFSEPSAENAPMLGWNPFKSIAKYFRRKKREWNDPTETMNPTIETEDGKTVRLNELALRLRGSDSFVSAMTAADGSASHNPMQSRDDPALWSIMNRPDKDNNYEFSAPSDKLGKTALAASIGSGIAGNLGLGASVADKVGLSSLSGALNTAAPIGKVVGNGLGLIGGALSFSNNLKGAAHARTVGNGNEELSSGLMAGSSAAKFISAGAGLSKNAAALAGAAVPSFVGGAVIPGLSIASGGFQAASGIARLSGAIKSTNRMNELMNRQGFLSSSDTLTARQFNKQSRKNKIEAGWDIGNGAVTAAGGIAAFFTAGLGSAVSAVAGLVGGIGKAIHTKKAQKKTVSDTLNEAVGFDEQINQTAKEYNISKSAAEKVVLRAMGCNTFSKEELFQRITLNRAIDLQQRAQTGDEQALAMLGATGLSEVKPSEGVKLSEGGRNYSLQGIAEKLGMGKSDIAKQWEMARVKTPLAGMQNNAPAVQPEAVPQIRPRSMSVSSLSGLNMPSGANQTRRRLSAAGV